MEEKPGVGPGNATRRGQGRCFPDGVEMKSVAPTKRVHRATQDVEKYFRPGRLDICEGQWGFCWVGTVRHPLSDKQKAVEGQGERHPV